MALESSKCAKIKVLLVLLCFRIVCTADSNAVTSFEEAFFPIFQGILQQDIQGM
jgi:hypothetical protein